MAIKIKTIYAFPFLAIALLTMSMRCREIEYRNIPELKNMKAIITILPKKDLYRVGDTIVLSIKAEKENWNSWPHFETANFYFPLMLYNVNDHKDSIIPLKDLSQLRSKAILVDGKWVIEQRSSYKLIKEKTYLFDFTYVFNERETERPYIGFRAMQITYYDANTDTHYMASVPIYFNDGSRKMKIVVKP